MDDPSTSGVTEGFGLMFYNARWYDPYLARFAQADSIVPAGVQGYDRYAYVSNNPTKYIDPTGHKACGDGYDDCADPNPDNLPSVGTGDGGEGNYSSYTHYGYIGGATPAELPGVIADGPDGVSGWGRLPEVVSEMGGIAQMYIDGYGYSNSTLRVFLGYYTESTGDVSRIVIDVENIGDSSARLNNIKLSEEVLPLTANTCTINTTCYFRPNNTVDIAPGRTATVTICKDCLENNTTVFSSPFYTNKNSLIEVRVSLSMLQSDGYKAVWTPIPFIYTIPRR